MGRLIRRTRIDELPQLLNVLKGEMSFVGPRPERPEFVAMLTEQIPFYAVRHSVKPGLTGWAQVKHPYGASIEEAAPLAGEGRNPPSDHAASAAFRLHLAGVLTRRALEQATA